MKKCTLHVHFMKDFMNTFLPLMNTMKALMVKYYLFLKKKETIKKIHTTIGASLYSQSVHSVHTLPLKCSYKCSLSLHTLFILEVF